MSPPLVPPCFPGEKAIDLASGTGTMGAETVLALMREGDTGLAMDRSGREKECVVCTLGLRESLSLEADMLDQETMDRGCPVSAHNIDMSGEE